MRTRLNHSLPALLMLVCLALAGRAWGLEAQDIIGRWEFLESRHKSAVWKAREEEKHLITEFRTDGTFTNFLSSGTYRCFKDGVVRLTFIHQGKPRGSKEYDVQVSADTLVMKNRDRSKFDPASTYQRMK